MNPLAIYRFYQAHFSLVNTFYIGLGISVFLILILIFREISGAIIDQKRASGTGSDLLALKRYRHRFGYLAWVLVIIFMVIIAANIVTTLQRP